MHPFKVESPLDKDEDPMKREEWILELGKLLSAEQRTEDLQRMISTSRPFLVTLGKAKAARIIRDLVDLCLKISQDGDVRIALVEESVDWATSQNHNFLRHALQARLTRLFNDLKRFSKALVSGMLQFVGTVLSSCFSYQTYR